MVECGGRIVAAMQIRRGRITPLSVESVVHTSFLVVAPQHRRHGYAHALMEAAVTWAEEKDVLCVTAITDADRDTNRFFARLGLAGAGHRASRRAPPRCARSSPPTAAGSPWAATGTWSRCWPSGARMRRRQAQA